MEDFIDVQLVGWVVAAVILIFLFSLPTFVAFYRHHSYRWIILALNIFGFTGIFWLVALIWAIFPSEKSLIDPLVGNVSGTGLRNSGDTLGATYYGSNRGSVNETVVTGEIERLAKMFAEGTIDQREFDALKRKVIDS